MVVLGRQRGCRGRGLVGPRPLARSEKRKEKIEKRVGGVFSWV